MGEILDRAAVIARVQQNRKDGLTHAFANGAFDLLHVGHIRYLDAAKREADRLIVAINDDGSVRALEGREPADPWRADRAELVAALRVVDYVVIFSEPTVTALLEAACGPRCTARAPTTPSRPCPSARPCAPTAGGSRSSAIPRTIPPATCCRGSATCPERDGWHDEPSESRGESHPDRPAERARRHRPRPAGAGGDHAAVAVGQGRLDGRSTRTPRSCRWSKGLHRRIIVRGPATADQRPTRFRLAALAAYPSARIATCARSVTTPRSTCRA